MFSTLTTIIACVFQMWKKIEENKKRAGDIIQVRMRNQDKRNEKDVIKNQREAEEQERLHRNRMEKERQR